MKNIAIFFLFGLYCCLNISQVNAQNSRKKSPHQVEKKTQKTEQTLTMQKVGKSTPITINTARKELHLVVPTKVIIDDKAVLEEQIEKLQNLIKQAESNPETYSKAYLEKYRQSLNAAKAKLNQL